MTDETARKVSEKFIALYTRYRAELDATPVGGQWMPYQWWKLPDRLSGIWMPYGQMLDEYARELANIINDLTHHVHRLRAWHLVVDKLSDEDKLATTHEFIDLLATVALGMPYAIKSRFAVAAGHLCHQANQTKDIKGWTDDFPSGNLYLHHIDPFCKGWDKYRPFMLAVEPIAGKAFRETSNNFRHAYNHGFSSHFVIGMSGVVERIAADDGSRDGSPRASNRQEARPPDVETLDCRGCSGSPRRSPTVGRRAANSACEHAHT